MPHISSMFYFEIRAIHCRHPSCNQNRQILYLRKKHPVLNGYIFKNIITDYIIEYKNEANN